MNVLLVESDDVMRSFFQAALEGEGFRVMAVKDNQGGRTVAEATRVDLVVAQFLDESDATGIADLLAALSARSPWFKLLAVVSGFRTRASTAVSLRQMLNPWRTVDLTRGGQVLIDACRAAAREQRSDASTEEGDGMRTLPRHDAGRIVR